jgi:hypothetical protein
MADTLVWVAYPVAAVVVVLFGIFALIVGWEHFRRTGKDSQEFFLTARDSAGIFRISWSFYAGVMGSWALFSAPSYAYTAGHPNPSLHILFHSTSPAPPQPSTLPPPPLPSPRGKVAAVAITIVDPHRIQGCSV